MLRHKTLQRSSFCCHTAKQRKQEPCRGSRRTPGSESRVVAWGAVCAGQPQPQLPPARCRSRLPPAETSGPGLQGEQCKIRGQLCKESRVRHKRQYWPLQQQERQHRTSEASATSAGHPPAPPPLHTCLAGGAGAERIVFGQQAPKGLGAAGRKLGIVQVIQGILQPSEAIRIQAQHCREGPARVESSHEQLAGGRDAQSRAMVCSRQGNQLSVRPGLRSPTQAAAAAAAHASAQVQPRSQCSQEAASRCNQGSTAAPPCPVGTAAPPLFQQTQQHPPVSSRYVLSRQIVEPACGSVGRRVW